MKIILKIFTFTIITLTALVLLSEPELVSTMIPGIVEKVYVAINKIIPIESKDDLTMIIVAIIMPIFAGIMRFISDFDDGIGGQIMAALLTPLVYIVVFFVCGVMGMLIGGFILYVFYSAPPLFLIISYIFCCYIMFKDFKNCNCDCNDCNDCNDCCVGECY